MARRWTVIALLLALVQGALLAATAWDNWLTVAAPDERIGYSIYVYRVDADRLVRLREARSTSAPFWRSGPPVARGDSLPRGRRTTMSRLNVSIQPTDPGPSLARAD